MFCIKKFSIVQFFRLQLKGRIVHCVVAKRPRGKMSRARNVLGVKRPDDETSRGRTEEGVKRP